MSFQNVASFYNSSTTNLRIINFGKIPLSRRGSQFFGLTNLTIQDTRSPVVLSDTSMANMFQNATNFNSDISSWNTSNVINMYCMFQNASSFNSDISRWDTSNVTDMTGMFIYASSFNSDISRWDTSNVSRMTQMFENALAFNQNIGDWDVSNVTNINNMRDMFVYALNFNNGGVPMNWTISFTGTLNFSIQTALENANKPQFYDSFDFKYSFDYTGSTPIADIIANYIPIIKTSNINYTYTFGLQPSAIVNIVNGNFSQPIISYNSYNYITSNSTVPGWNFNNVVLENNSEWGFRKPYPNGNQSAVIQATAYMEKIINLNSDSYTLSFMACGRPSPSQANPISIQLNGTTFFSVTPPTTNWASYSTTFNVTTSGNNTIKFLGTNSSLYYSTAFQGININYNTNVVSIKSTFTDDIDKTTHDGLSFKNVAGFYNTNTTNLKIINFGKIPLSRGGSQFRLRDLTIQDTRYPIVLSNTSMANMFQDATNFNSDISRWNTSNVTNMSAMFNAASNFNSNISGWNTSNVTNMSDMFNAASNFNSNISGWNITNVTNMSQMFRVASKFNSDISRWNTSNVTDINNMNNMFNDATVFNNGQAEGGTIQKMNWTISFIGTPASFSNSSALENANKPQFYETFDFKYSFDYIGSTSIADIDNVTYIPIINDSDKIRYTRTLSYSGSTVTVTITPTLINGIEATNDGLSFQNVAAFYNGTNVTNLKIINFGKIPLSRGGSQFLGLTKLAIQDTRSPNILTNTSMYRMFRNATNFNSDISRWNTSNVTNMGAMFLNASIFDKDISRWNTSLVTDMRYMFGASAFNQDISGWNTSNVTDMSYMFVNASAFNQDISGWNTSNVTNMSNMFIGATNFNNLGSSLNSWNTSSVTDKNNMNNMFEGATVFNNGGVPMNWTISFIGTPENFSNGSALTEANKPQFYETFDFIYSFDYTGSTPIADIANATYIPIITDSDKIRYTRTLSYSGSTVTVTITYTLINGIEAKNDGLSFQRVGGFYNNNTTNLRITNFGKIPLSRGSSQFSSLSKLTIQDTRTPLVLSKTSMAAMFQGAANFNSDISRWNTSNVIDMSFMFSYASNFNKDIGGWNTTNVTNMSQMFLYARAFNKNIGNWNTSKVTDMTGMFLFATVFNNGQAAGEVTQKMNWIISFSGIPEYFSYLSALQNANKPKSNW